MKISQICALVLLVVVGSAVAFADSINDPKIIIQGVAGGGGKTASGCPQCKLVGVNFTFSVPKDGSGTDFFTNNSGKNWTSLTLIETGEPAKDITCQFSFFLTCTTKTLKNGSVEIVLSGVHGDNPRTGIGAGQNFEIVFACQSGSCWKGGIHFTAHAGTTPEPGTVALMITGLGMIVSRRKLWKNRFNS